ncbi:MAG: dihydrodipicolinate synthase family protein [Solirubrobacterales bacterium]
MTLFPGVLPAVLTPFDESGEIDQQGLVDHAEFMLDQGVHGLVTTGTMGEAGSMTRDERSLVTRLVADFVAGRVPVVAGVSAQTPAEVIAYAADAAEAGANAVMLLPPVVYEADERELAGFYTTVGEAIELPIMLYNNPKASGSGDLSADTITALIDRVEKIVAVKECSGDARRIAALQGAGAEILIGGDDWALEGFFAGSHGWVSGVANVAPRACADLYEQCERGDVEAARATYQALLPLARLDMRPKLVQYFKAACRELGRDLGVPRAPRMELTDEDMADVTSAVAVLEGSEVAV